MSESNFHETSFKLFKVKNQKSFDHIWANKSKTCNYTPVTHGEPPPHRATVYGEIPSTHNYSNMQPSLCHSVTTIAGCCNVVHDGQHFLYRYHRIGGIRKFSGLYNIATLQRYLTFCCMG